MSDRHPVPFERTGLLPIFVLLLLGSSSVAAAVSSLAPTEPPIAAPATAQTAPAPSAPAPPALTTSTAAPSAPVSDPSAEPMVSSKAPPGPCAPRVAVLFASGEGGPPVGASAGLRRLATFLHDHPETTLAISGHADAKGTDDANIALSHRRARSVARLLEDAGVARHRMTVRGFGAFQPLEGSDETAPDNRRVILRVRGMPSCDQLPEEVIAP